MMNWFRSRSSASYIRLAEDLSERKVLKVTKKVPNLTILKFGKALLL